ncbi:cyclase family protein [Testudinibacter sp. TR-2022]|uniref:cyclase family protein n=1 Tax=Testudinibacter sp. TR-2022 TaxID=2585029 RepID=UPI00111B7B62|nr:cyclase family protein [Testudinibacter sp. TR-2022]TNH05476.1 cyclase family protein [Pasteurellaceae bacterium Phil11]TNH21266.1 cyclase family protein [Testudinibacter sp. TR-2022]TNH27890.1 cyclase family protein [Testudinibacter sp. TR-2022]
MSLSTLQLLEQLKQKQWVDLTHEFGPNSPHFPAFNDAEFKTLFDHSDGFFVHQYTFPGQYGTHIDPPIHFAARQPRYINDLKLKQELVLPLIVIDKSKEAAEDPDFTLQPEDILAWEQQHGIIPEGAFVALRTDWSKRWPDKARFANADAQGQNHYPGWSVAALQFIYEQRNAVANGHETFDTDAAVNQQNGLIAELYVLENNHYQVELLANLDQCPPTGAVIFCIAPKAEKSPGFPVRAFAILP